MTRQLVAAVSSLLALAATGCCLCPRVYRVAPPAVVQGSAPARRSFGVLFIPSGFARRDLPAYRTATDELAKGVLAESPYGRLTADGSGPPRVEFYRIDLVGRHPKVTCRDSGRSQPIRSPPTAGAGPVGTPLDPTRRRASSPRLDLGVELITCDEFWISALGQVAALELARCVRGVDTVVIVVNLDSDVGQTHQAAGTGDIGLAIISVTMPVENLAASSVDGRFVADSAIHLLRHELGHTLGLMDEYFCCQISWPCNARTWPAESQFRAGRNVWKENPGDRLSCSDIETVLRSVGSAPWKVPDTQESGKCFNEGTCLENPNGRLTWCDGLSKVGLWEGAYYRESGYFRSEEKCEMRFVASPFCKVCSNYLEEALDRHSQPQIEEERPAGP